MVDPSSAQLEESQSALDDLKSGGLQPVRVCDLSFRRVVRFEALQVAHERSKNMQSRTAIVHFALAPASKTERWRTTDVSGRCPLRLLSMLAAKQE